MLIISRDEKTIERLKGKLSVKWTMTDLWIARRFLGPNLHYSDENDITDRAFTSQKSCVDGLVTDFSFQPCRPT
jgi:hypothetical protein